MRGNERYEIVQAPEDLAQLKQGTRVGEIGLDAVNPNQAGLGTSTAMYRFALSRMKETGMRLIVGESKSKHNRALQRAPQSSTSELLR